MKISLKPMHTILLMFITAVFLAAGCASTPPAQPGWYPHLVDVKFVEQYAVLPLRNDVMIIDARPTGRKYDPGHIPGAISLPETDFEKHSHLLPADKNTLLIFYCGGTECMLSHKSAFKAEALGYSRIRVYPYGYPDWIKAGHVGAVSPAYVKKLLDSQADVMVIDSRPKARKYDKGHIPGAISLPDSQFAEMSHLLPADKSTPLIFYCGGYDCTLSSSSATRAQAMGYSDVKVMPAGYPAWKQAYGSATASPAPAAAPIQAQPAGNSLIETGKDPAVITVASFKKIMASAPESLLVIDVRDAGEFARASLPGAINIPINTLEDRIDSLPDTPPIVFFCGAGGRSGEAHDMVQMFRPGLRTYFLDAHTSFNKDGSYTMAPN